VLVRQGEGPAPASAPMAVEEGVAVRGLEGRATHAYPSTEAVLEAVATGRERAGYVIATRGAWLAHERWPGKLELLPATRADTDAFALVAAVRKSDVELKDAIDHAWDELNRSGRLARAFAHWHIPYEPVTAAASENAH
jgi:ABC-type amino acid transport substrate-binding protein